MWFGAEIPVVPPTPVDQTGNWLLFAGGVVAVIGTIVVAFLNRKQPAPADTTEPVATRFVERLAVVESQLGGVIEALKDTEETLDLVDRRQSKTEHIVEDLKPRVQELGLSLERLRLSVARLHEEPDP